MQAALFISISICVLSGFALVAFGRMLCKAISGEHWSRAYIRSAAETGVFANLVLVLMTVAINSSYRDWSHLSLSQFDSLNAESLLTMVDFYLRHFCPIVLLPAILVAQIGKVLRRRTVPENN